ncbi:hypothetical protein K438DRAFT_1779819 [Mycena galopus ATCC 62051]|nr:hypothetical protein K438DRAFT_1779819 [Mycena galopus ATCC 62051]
MRIIKVGILCYAINLSSDKIVQVGLKWTLGGGWRRDDPRHSLGSVHIYDDQGDTREDAHPGLNLENLKRFLGDYMPRDRHFIANGECLQALRIEGVQQPEIRQSIRPQKSQHFHVCTKEGKCRLKMMSRRRRRVGEVKSYWRACSVNCGAEEMGALYRLSSRMRRMRSGEASAVTRNIDSRRSASVKEGFVRCFKNTCSIGPWLPKNGTSKISVQIHSRFYEESEAVVQ